MGVVVKASPHSAADHIRIAWVDTGDGQLRQIVYGGKVDMQVGYLVPVARPGSRLPDGTKIRSRTYRGVRSEGMLCSLAEIGWDPNEKDRVHIFSSGDGKPGDSVTNTWTMPE